MARPTDTMPAATECGRSIAQIAAAACTPAAPALLPPALLPPLPPASQTPPPCTPTSSSTTTPRYRPWAAHSLCSQERKEGVVGSDLQHGSVGKGPPNRAEGARKGADLADVRCDLGVSRGQLHACECGGRGGLGRMELGFLQAWEGGWVRPCCKRSSGSIVLFIPPVVPP